MKHVLKLLGIMMLLLVVMTGAAAAATDVLTITSQPVNKSVVAGSTVKFAVTAETPATSISYQWQYRKDASSAWAPSAQSGNKTATLYVSATAGLNGYQFRCMVKDSNGSTVYSDAATLNIIPKITTQPVSKTVAPGATATFTVAATGTGTLTYQWQYRKDSASSWASSAQNGNKTATLSVAATNGLHGYQFRCVITNGNGQKSYSSAATLSVSPRITSQPSNKTAVSGTTASFSVAASGEGTLSYLWQFRKDANSTWTTSGQSGFRTATLSVAVTNGLHGYQFRCVITDGSERKAYSNAATLSVIPKIATQPVSTTVAPGTKATFIVEATGKGTLMYQWQYRTDANSAWAASAQSGNKTATLTVNATNGLHGYQFRCVITDGNGQKAYSNAATLSISPRITAQPADKCVSLGTTATFSVTAAGTGTLKYQWQYLSPSMTAWASSAQSGNKTSKLSVSTTGSLQGYRFRCKITDGSGAVVYTKAVTLTLCDIPINKTFFPDEIFRKYIKDNFDTVNDGKLSRTEIQQVGVIRVNYKGISSLKGVEFFAALENLYCCNNNLATLDLRRNASLEYVYCPWSNITSLNVSRNTALTKLDCHNNNLTVLDVSKNSALENLICYNNPLLSLDVSKNTALTELNCANDKLTELNLSKNTALKVLNCGENKLNALNLRNNTALVELNCRYCDLTSLDLSKNTELTRILCYANELTELNVSYSTSLISLNCAENKLTALDVSKNTELEVLDCKQNGLTLLDVSKNTELEVLDCKQNGLTLLNVSKNTALKVLECEDNSLTSINVSENPALQVLSCYGEGITSLNLRKNTELTELACGGCEDFTSLDVSANTALTKLWCEDSGLTSLDVSKNTALTFLDCDNNSVSVLVLGRNTGLETLHCANNSLSALDVSKNTGLKTLSCSNNYLTVLEVSNNTELEYFDCQANDLTTLDLSNNALLKNFRCDPEVNVIR